MAAQRRAEIRGERSHGGRWRRTAGLACHVRPIFLALLVAAALAIGVACTAEPQPATAPSSTATAVAVAAEPTATAAPPSPTRTPAPTASPHRTPAPARATATPGASNFAVDIEAIAERLAAVRGLEFLEEVPLGILARTEVESYFLRTFEKDYPAEDLHRDRALLVLLDLLDEEDDLHRLWLDLLSEQVIGFYEVDTREMKLVSSGDRFGPLDEVTLAHEYVHALQDQHFNLGDRMKELEDQGEKGLALRAVAEGDATLSMLLYGREHLSAEEMAQLLKQSGGVSAEKLESAPLALKATLLFPYQYGLLLVSALARSGGWAAVNEALENPPTTSEQVMHPDKYRAGEGPRAVPMPNVAGALGPTWTPLERDTFGEFGLLTYLLPGIGPTKAGRAAAGWGGDEYLLLEDSSGRHALAALTAWDTENDARQFFEALRLLRESYADNRFTADEATRLAWAAGERRGYTALRGEHVLLLIAPDEPTLRRLMDAFPDYQR